MASRPSEHGRLAIEHQGEVVEAVILASGSDQLQTLEHAAVVEVVHQLSTPLLRRVPDHREVPFFEVIEEKAGVVFVKQSELAKRGRALEEEQGGLRVDRMVNHNRWHHQLLSYSLLPSS